MSSASSAAFVSTSANIADFPSWAESDPSKPCLLWIDCEMTGLDESKEKIVEFACRVTDMKELRVFEEYSSVVRVAPAVLEAMGDYVRSMHRNNGLLAELEAQKGVEIAQVERDVLAMIDRHFPTTSPLIAGNTIGADRRFIKAEAPTLHARLHYRQLDISSWKVVFETLFKQKVPKAGKHRALADIDESIKEFKYYLRAIDISKLLTDAAANKKHKAEDSSAQ